MNGKERLTRLFEGKDIDRIPIWLQFPYFIAPYYTNIFESTSYAPVLKRVFEYSEIVDRQRFDTGFAFSNHQDIKEECKTYMEGYVKVSEKVISYKDIVLKSSARKGKDSTLVEPFIKDIEDLDKILQLPYLSPRPNMSDFIEKERILGDKGLMGIDLGDPLTILHDLCDPSEFTIFIQTDTKKVLEFLDVMFERVFKTYKYMLENGAGPVFWISGAEFAVPPMVSPLYFNDLVVTYTKKLCDLIRSYGKWSMIHCHGRIKKVLDGINEIGFDSIHPIESPPMGDCTLTEARNVFGKDKILVGNIQYGDLWQKTEEEMEQHVIDVIEEGKTGRFILATTGGPSATNINDQVVKNYYKIIDTALKFGQL